LPCPLAPGFSSAFSAFESCAHFSRRKRTISSGVRRGKADFHALRVTYTSLIIEAGASVREDMTAARHVTPGLTLGVYAKARNSRLQELAEKVVGAVLDAPEAFAGIPCAHCGCLFVPTRSWARFCCRECRLAAAGLARKPRAIENCQYCGAPLAGKRSHAKYCSPACRLAAHKAKNGPRQAHVEDRGEG